MPEHRARKHHQDRVAETLREEIGAMIEGELSDPRIAFCYVSEVALNPGGKSARVYVAVDNAVKDIAKAEADTVAALESAKGYIRSKSRSTWACATCRNSAFSPTAPAASRRASRNCWADPPNPARPRGQLRQATRRKQRLTGAGG